MPYDGVNQILGGVYRTNFFEDSLRRRKLRSKKHEVKIERITTLYRRQYMTTPAPVFRATEKCVHCNQQILGESGESQADAEMDATYNKTDHEEGCAMNPINIKASATA